MGKLYDTAQLIEAFIRQRDLPIFITRGKVAIHTGFPLGMIREDTPDDPEMLTKLRAAARMVLGDAIEL